MIVLSILCAMTFTVAAQESAQDSDAPKKTRKESWRRCHVNIGAGVIFPQQWGPDIDANKADGYDYLFGVGGRVGVELYVPLYKGLFLKPALYGEYIHDGYEKNEFSSYSGRRANLPSHDYYEVTISDEKKESSTNDTWELRLPVTLGYNFRYDRKVSFSIGAVGYVGVLLAFDRTLSTSTYHSVSPDKFGETKKKENNDKTNMLDGAGFTNRLAYGVGGQLGMQAGKFFMHYTMLYNLKRSPAYHDPDKCNETVYHNVTFGVCF